MGKLNLNGEWRLKSSNKNIDIIATVPGDVSNDLKQAKIIQDPYYGENYKNTGFINKTEWSLKTEFIVTQELKNSKRVELVFKGVDTYANVFLNNKLIANLDSMFKTYCIDIAQFIQEGKNILEVNLIGIDLIKKDIEAKDYVSIFDAKRIYMRKSQCHFGWDWAPNLPGLGIYRDVYIEYSDGAKIESCLIQTQMSGDVTFKLEVSEICDEIQVTVGKIANSFDEIYSVTARTKKLKNIVNIKIENPQLWFPNNYGNQNLYNYSVKLLNNGKVTDEKCGKFGIKEVLLCENPIDGDSLNFCFYINDIKVYCKGSNWVPANCMTGCIKPSDYYELIEKAKAANFNMLRVWGGGIYESDEFYDYCDDAGIMVWQDFMFACQDVIDDDDKFVRIYTEEAESQLKRIGNHACLTYLCGGNEKTGAFHFHSPQFGNYFLKYVLRGIVATLTPKIPYGYISPFSYGDIDNETQSGDCHTNVSELALENHDVKNFYKFFDSTVSNFSSECAVQGPCRYKSLKKFIPTEKLDFRNNIYRERFLGNPFAEVMGDFIDRQIYCAAQMFGEITNTKDFVKKAMQAHYDIIKAEIDFNTVNGRNNGFLNWMYNDIWPQGTWAVIDFYKTLKPAYYAMKKAFAPVKVCFVRSKNEFNFCFVNHSNSKIETNAAVRQFDYSGKLMAEKTYSICVKAGCAIKFLIELNSCDCYFTCTANVNGEFLTDIYDVNAYAQKEKSNLEYRIDLEKSEICINSHGLEKSVFIEVDDSVTLSDNYFSLWHGQSKIVYFKYNNMQNIKDIKVKSFNDVWDS